MVPGYQVRTRVRVPAVRVLCNPDIGTLEYGVRSHAGRAGVTM